MSSRKTLALNITVRYFAQARELAGVKEQHLQLSGKVHVQDIVSRSIEIHPRLGEIKQIIRAIVNGRFTDENSILRDGDIVALLPPTAGG